MTKNLCRIGFFLVLFVCFQLNHVGGGGGIPFKAHKAGAVPQPQNEVEGVDPRDASLLKSSSEGDIDAVKRVLAAGAQIECRDHRIGNTPLIWASFHGRLQVIKVLVEKGANIEAISTDGHKTALLMAAYSGHADAVVYLLRQGARIDRANDRGDTSLSLATYMNHTKTVEVLLYRRADIRLKAKESHYTPVHIAASKGHDQILDMLLIDGIAALSIINSKDKQGNTPFLLAVSSGKRKTVEYFLENQKGKFDVYAKDIIGNSAVMLAVNNGHIDVVEFLLDETDLDIDECNLRGETPLIRSSLKGNAEILRYLLTKGANVDLTNSNDEDATDVAVNADNKKCVVLLEEYYRLSGRRRKHGHVAYASGVSLDSLKDTVDDDRFTTIGTIEL